MTFKVVIPARYASTRLPGKPLRDIAGKPMIQHVYERAAESGAEQVMVATDHEDILRACEQFGARACMTDANHASGTDRIAEVSRTLGWSENEIVVNVQCDEPLIPPAIIHQVAELLRRRPEAHVATLAERIHLLKEYLDPNVVKVVLDESGSALYFSRAPIPWNRDTAPHGLMSQTHYNNALRHIGLYAYRVTSLRVLADTPPPPLETTEHLEQLRALWLGMSIQVAIASEPPGPSVDTEEDLATVAAKIAEG